MRSKKIISVAVMTLALNATDTKSATSTSIDAEIIRKHTTTQNLQDQPLASRELTQFGLLLAGLQQSPSEIADLGLSSSDAAALESLSSTESEFEASVRAASRREMQLICSWGADTDAVVLATAIVAVDAEVAAKRAERMQVLFQAISVEGRGKLSSHMASSFVSGSSSTIDLVSLAAERPEVIRKGLARRCAQLEGLAESATIIHDSK